ncbi:MULTISPECIES: hypothetical protein [Spirosoma]|uniref:DUF3108 domain-containing protein n=1 Tax=Spirosoma sordidisoli TaxID=2502893 RepID=A0A4Q2UVJ6_9BACT|nr:MULTISPECIES: hypothetical protein [Spirosoma]RYC71860.1 hypothetical protein EQG79_06955 [Spirosoma sordidisoli]
MKNLFLSVVTGLMLTGAGGIAAPVWSTGELQLANGTLLKGELNYNWKAEIVRYRQGDVVKAYSALQVSNFRYFDTNQNTLRKFVSVLYPFKSKQVRPQFAEECTAGPLTVYRQLRPTREMLRIGNSIATEADPELVKNMDNFEYFVVDGQDVVRLRDFSRTLWPRMCDEFGQALQQYVIKRDLNVNTTLTRLLLINHYNYLKIQAVTEPDEVPSLGR